MEVINDERDTFEIILDRLERGDLEAAWEIQRANNFVLENAGKEFRSRLRDCVAHCLIMPGMTVEEVLKKACDLGGDMDFSKELSYLDAPRAEGEVQSA